MELTKQSIVDYINKALEQRTTDKSVKVDGNVSTLNAIIDMIHSNVAPEEIDAYGSMNEMMEDIGLVSQVSIDDYDYIAHILEYEPMSALDFLRHLESVGGSVQALANGQMNDGTFKFENDVYLEIML